MPATEWPKRPDGSNKTVGEMSADERGAVTAASKARVMSGRNHEAALPVDWWQPA